MIASTMVIELGDPSADRSALVKWSADITGGRVNSATADSVVINNDAALAPTADEAEEINHEVRAAARRVLHARLQDIANMRRMGYPRRGSKFFGRIRGRR